MRYKNAKTGVIIDVQSAISGGDWVAVGASKVSAKQAQPLQTATAPKVAAAPAKKPVATSAADGIDSVTVAQIKQELDSMGVAYSKTAKKPELYALMMEA